MSAYSQADAGSSIQKSLDALAPRYDVAHTTYGIDAIAIRPLDDGSSYIRTTKYVLPFVSLVPSAPGGSDGDVDGVIFIVSPVDDTNHVLFFGFWSVTREINDGTYTGIPRAQQSLVGDRPFDRDNFGGFTGGRDDNWGQDREAMKRGHFSGFTGNLLQEDTVTQVSMGPIVDRTKEHLSSSDVAIIHARRVLLAALDRVAAGQPPIGDAPPVDHLDVIPTDEVIPPEQPKDVPALSS